MRHRKLSEKQMILELNDFHMYLGQTVMYCQIIEHDVKFIFAIMCKGDIAETLEMIEKERWTLGLAINELRAIDCQSGKTPNISDADYNFLKQITKKRNYWCHSAYLNFVYNANFKSSPEYKEICENLINDNTQLKKVYKNLETIKLNLLKNMK